MACQASKSRCWLAGRTSKGGRLSPADSLPLPLGDLAAVAEGLADAPPLLDAGSGEVTLLTASVTAATPDSTAAIRVPAALFTAATADPTAGAASSAAAAAVVLTVFAALVAFSAAGSAAFRLLPGFALGFDADVTFALAAGATFGLDLDPTAAFAFADFASLGAALAFFPAAAASLEPSDIASAATESTVAAVFAAAFIAAVVKVSADVLASGWAAGLALPRLAGALTFVAFAFTLGAAAVFLAAALFARLGACSFAGDDILVSDLVFLFACVNTSHGPGLAPQLACPGQPIPIELACLDSVLGFFETFSTPSACVVFPR